ncbi:MAG: indole-3-glycerol phosphate synthase TrpC [Actinomycetes bacterium]
MATYLDRIIAAHRDTAAQDDRRLDRLVDEAASRTAVDPVRGFGAQIQAAATSQGVAVIAEIKRRSPSKGLLSPDLDPAALAMTYADGGAACMSVLTDDAFFGGSSSDLSDARMSCMLPVLRKDFTVSGHDIADARIMGADAVLLIAVILDDAELVDFITLASELGLDALVEIHDEGELERATRAGAKLIGVNQRDLVTFEVDTDRAVRLAPQMPAGVIRVAESGIRSPADAKVLVSAGYQAVLVGESFVTANDPRASVAAMCSLD